MDERNLATLVRILRNELEIEFNMTMNEIEEFCEKNYKGNSILDSIQYCIEDNFE